MRSCLQSEDPRYRHDFVVAFSQLLERTLFAAKALLKRAKKESFAWAKTHGLQVTSLSDVLKTRAALSPECQVGEKAISEDQEMVEHWEAAQRTLEAIATFLLQSIRTTTSTAALMLVADLLQTLVSRCGAEVGVDALFDAVADSPAVALHGVGDPPRAAASHQPEPDDPHARRGDGEATPRQHVNGPARDDRHSRVACVR